MATREETVRQGTIAGLRAATHQVSKWRTLWEGRIAYAVSLGIPLREVGRAAGVDASTVKRIAERQK